MKRETCDWPWLKMRICCFFIFVFVSGCANTYVNVGVNEFKHGNYDNAAKLWISSAKDGNHLAQYNLGILWEHGLGSTPLDKEQAAKWYLLSARQSYVPAMVRLAKIQKEFGYEEQALSWLNMAARWGDRDAINILQGLGKDIPSADLLTAQQYREAKSQQATIQAASELGGVIGSGLGGGGGAVAPLPSSSVLNSPSPSSSITTQSGTSEVFLRNSCTSDFSCGVGSRCVKSPLQVNGVCMQTVNEYGVKQYNTPNVNSAGPNLNLDGQCFSDIQCPIGFRCDQTFKTCLKL